MLEKNTCEGEINLSMTCNFTKNDTPLQIVFFSVFYQFKFWDGFYIIATMPGKRLLASTVYFLYLMFKIIINVLFYYMDNLSAAATEVVLEKMVFLNKAVLKVTT